MGDARVLGESCFAGGTSSSGPSMAPEAPPETAADFAALLANEESLPAVLQTRPELAKQNLERFLRENCAACHGGRKSRVVPALNVLDMESLVEKRYVVWGKPEESFIVQRAKNREMPPRPNRLRQGEPILLASYVKQSEEPEAKDIFTVLDSDTRLTTVVDLVRTTGLVQELQQPGPLTILAPTNEAFDKLPEARRKSLMEARGEAFAVLLNHAVPWGTPLSASDLEQRRRVSSAALCELIIDRSATGQLKIGNAIVVQADIQCSNGVIHVIDRVLLPGEPPPGEETEPPHYYFIVMDYVEGGTLADPKVGEGLSLLDAADLIARVADAVHFAHTKGLLHRDIKPANILLDGDGAPQVADFGLAVHESEQPRKRGEFCGTLHYMSPEQVQGYTDHLDGRTDIWSLGVTLYELLSHRRPFLSDSRQELIEQILHRDVRPLRQIDESTPRTFEQICMTALQKEPSARYDTASDLARELRKAVRAERARAKLLSHGLDLTRR